MLGTCLLEDYHIHYQQDLNLGPRKLRNCQWGFVCPIDSDGDVGNNGT